MGQVRLETGFGANGVPSETGRGKPAARSWHQARSARLRRRWLSLAAAVSLALPLPAVHAATYTWDAGGGATTTWSTPANWNPDVVPPFVAGDVFDLTTLDIAAASTSTVDQNATLGVINIGDATTSSNIWTLNNANGAVLTLDNLASNAQINQTATSFGDTISVPLAIKGNLDLTNANVTAARTLILSGGITSSATTGTQTITRLGAAGGVTISGGVGDGSTGGRVAVSHSAGGTLTLSGANTFTGQVTVGAVGGGNLTFVAGNATALGSPIGQTVVNGGSGGGIGTKLQIGAVTIANETLVLATGASSARSTLSYNATSGSGTWNGNILLTGAGSSQLYSEQSGGTLVVGAANFAHTITSTGTGNLTVRGNGAGTLNSTVNIGNNAFSKTDGANFTLNSPGNVWGSTQISTGTITLGVNDALPQNAALTLGQTGTTSSPVLNLNGKLQTVASLGDSQNGVTATLTSSVAGGVFTLNTTAANTYGMPTVTNTGNGGIITGAANLSLVKLGGGSLTLNGKAVNTYTGATTVNAGLLRLDFANLATPTNLLNSGTTLVVGGGTFDITARPSATTSQTVNGLTVNAGGSTVSATNSVAGTPDTLLALGAITRPAGGGTVRFVLPTGTQTATNGITTSSATVNGILGGWAVVGSDWATVDAGNIVANSTYTDVDRLGGQIASNDTANVRIIESGAGANVTPAAAGTTNIHTLHQNAIGGVATYAPGAADVLRLGTAGGVMLAELAGPLVIGTGANVGVLTAGGVASDAAGDLSFVNQSANVDLTVNSTIANNGAGAVRINKAGVGRLVLNGTNTYTDGTSVGGGTVVLGNAAALGNANNPLNVTSGAVDLNGNSVGVGNFTGTGGTVLNNATGTSVTFTIGNGDATGGVFRGVIANNSTGTGTVALTKVGTGTLVLAGNNTYGGPTTVSAGTLVIGEGGAAGSLGSNAGPITVNGSLAFNRADNVTLANQVTGSGSLQQLGRGTLTVTSATNNYAGGTSISLGTIAIAGGNDRLPTTGTLTFAGPLGTLDLGANSQTLANLAFTNSTKGTFIRGTGTLTVNGTAGDLSIGPVGANNVTITLNLSGLSNFVYNSPTRVFRVGPPAAATGGTVSNQNATVTLATTNTITAQTFAVADLSLNANAGNSTLFLGQTNTINATNVNAGFSGRSGATLAFASNLAGPTATFRGVNGTDPVSTFNIGRVTNNSPQTYSASVDFSAGNVNLLTTSMIIGSADTQTSTTRQGTVNGFFTMGEGNVTAGTITVGQIANTDGNGTTTGTTTANFVGNGTLTMNNAAGTLNVTTLKLAENIITANTGTTRTVSGTFNLVDGTLKAGTIQNPDGVNQSITGLPITLLAGTHTFNVTGTQTTTVDAASPIAGASGITKTGPGTLSLAADNAYTGGTSIVDGTLTIAAAERLANASPMTLAGGTFATAGFSETLDTLGVSSSSKIDLGSGASVLSYANSSGVAWSGVLTIDNWSGTPVTGGGTDQVYFGVDATGLTPAQLAQINFTGFGTGAEILPTGEIVPVPEPTTSVLLAAAGLGLLARRRRRGR